MTRPALEVLRDGDAVAARGAEVVAEEARAAGSKGRFTFAVSGGHTPWAMFARLAAADVPWEHVTLFQVDERVAPDGDDARNLTHLLASIPPDAAADVRPMPVNADDLEHAADEYARALPDRLHLVHLGLGPDGHTASLVPGDPVLDVIDRDVAVTGVYQGRRRMTLTYRALDRAQRILWLVTGADKADALARLVAGDRSIPGGRVSAERALVLADEAAAASLETGGRG